MKKRVSLLLVVVMLLSMLPVAVSAAETTVLLEVTDEAVTTSGYTYEYTAETAGTLNVTVGTCSPGWRYKIYSPDGSESIYRTKYSAGESCDYEGEAGNWKIVFYAYSSAQADNVAGTVSFTVTFTPAEGGSGEVEKAEYEVSETALALGDNTVTMLDTAVTTIYVFEPTETGVFTFTAPEGAILGYWGAGSWFLQNPNSTTNTYEWTCTGVGQSAYIGVSGVEGEFNLNVAKTGDYTVVETPIVTYENKATLETFTVPEGATLGGYVDVMDQNVTHTAVLGDDGYYHLDSVDGGVLLVDMNYMDIILSAALKSDRPVMYAYMTDEDGNKFKYDIGDAVLEYEAVMDANGYYPVTEDILLFYQVYAVQAGTYTFHVSGSYNEDCVWMYCMRTMNMDNVVTEPEETEPTEPEETEPTEPEETEPTQPSAGMEVFNDTVSADSNSKKVISYTPEEDGTLTVTIGDGTSNWESDLRSVVGLTFTSIASAKGSAQQTYTADVTASIKYQIRVWSTNSAATPVTVVFQAAGAVEPEEPETEPTEPAKNAYEVSSVVITAAGSHSLTMLDTAVTTVFGFKPTEAGTYTITGPDGSVVGNWGSNAYYLTDPAATTNSCEWTCSSVGQSVYIGISGVEGNVTVTVEKQEEVTEPTEPETTEPSVPESSEPEVEPTIPSIPDEDVPTGTYYSITVDGNTTYYTSFSVTTMNSNLKKITGTGYVKLYQDLALGSNNCLEIYNGTITLDLNGYSITNSYSSIGTLYMDAATVTIVDTSVDADGSIYNSNTKGHGLMVNSGTVTLQSGNVTSEYWGVSVYEPDAVFNMEGGYVYGKTYAVNVLNYSSANISGGILESTGLSTLVAGTNATVYISGGYFNGSVPSGTGLNGRVSGGYYTASLSAARLAEGCEVVENNDSVYKYKVVDPNATEEPTEPETEPTEPVKNAYTVSSTTLAVGSNTVTMVETAEATIFKFTPSETGTYTITGPEGSQVGIWGYSTAYLVNPNSTSNTFEWECANVGPSIYVGVLDAEGEIVLTVEHTPAATEPTEPEVPETSEPETEPTEPEVPETSEPETEPTEPEVPETSEPAADGTLVSVTNETVTTAGYTFEYTAETAGTLNVTVGTCSPGWRYKIYSPDGSESIYRTKYSAGESCDYEGEAGNWKIVFYAYSSTQADNVAGTVSFTVTFTPNEGGDSGEVEKAEYEVSETPLALGDNTVTLLDTAITTIFAFEPTETGVFTFTAPEGAILGYWGAGDWFLSNPNSTTNTYEWTCTGVGQSAYIGVSGVEGEFNLNVAKTGDYTVVETPIVTYENKATLETFTVPEGATLGGYVDVMDQNVTHTAVLGDDGYYHLDSVDGAILLIDMDYMDIILSAALKSDRPVMYAYMTDEDGNKFKYDIGDAVLEYEAVMDANGYYPVTEDILLFYQVYAVQAGTYTFHVSGSYNEDCVWMYCMRTMTLPEPAVAQVGDTQYATLAEAIANANGNTVVLLADCGDVSIAADVTIDLAGFNLTNVTVADGATLYLVDSATNDFEGAYGTASVTGAVAGGENYLVVNEDGKYSAHYYEVKLTYVSLDPTNDALGYKAQLLGDEIVYQYVSGFGFNMGVAGGASKTYTKEAGADFDGTFTLRLKGIMAANGGEMAITGSAFVIFSVEDKTATSDEHTTTMKQTIETINANFGSYSAEQQAAVKELVNKYASKMEGWNLDQIITEE